MKEQKTSDFETHLLVHSVIADLKVEEYEKQLKQLREENAQLRDRLEKLEAKVEKQ